MPAVNYAFQRQNTQCVQVQMIDVNMYLDITVLEEERSEKKAATGKP